MKLFFTLCISFLSLSLCAQRHDDKGIRFLFETEFDHIGNVELETRKIKLFNHAHHLIYEADLYNAEELDETFYYYDEKGNLLKERKIYSENHKSGKIIITYDKNGNRIEEKEINDLDIVTSRNTYTYDAKGRLISEQKELKHKDEDHTFVESKFDLTYNEAGKLISKKGFEYGHEEKTVEYKYVYKDLTTILKRYSKDELVEKWEDTYDADGKILIHKHSTYANNQETLRKHVLFTYDEFGHVVSEEMKNPKGGSLSTFLEFEYVYDEFGNWTEKKMIKRKGQRSEVVSTISRMIEYYHHDSYEHPPLELDETWIFEANPEGGENKKVATETHTRINTDDGTLAWVVRRNGAALYQVDEFEYENGKLVKINHLNNEKKDNAYSVFTYDDAGVLTLEETFSFEDKLEEKTIYSYNSKGQLIKQEEYFKNRLSGKIELEVTILYEYDANGRVSTKEVAEYGIEFTCKYTYDDQGKCLTMQQDPKSKDDQKELIKYEYNGELLTSELIYLDNSKEPDEKTEFIYDEHNEIHSSSFFEGEELKEYIEYQYFE